MRFVEVTGFCRVQERGDELSHWNNWSGRRESNPRMQLGKLGSYLTYQELSYKTHAFRIYKNQ